MKSKTQSELLDEARQLICGIDWSLQKRDWQKTSIEWSKDASDSKKTDTRIAYKIGFWLMFTAFVALAAAVKWHYHAAHGVPWLGI